MVLNNQQVEQLCQWCGVLQSDAAAVAVLRRCYDRAYNWYLEAGCDMSGSDIETWVFDLAAWFYDNRGRSDVQIPPYIVQSVHQLRSAGDPA